MGLSDSEIKKLLIFSQKKAFLIFWETAHFSVQARKNQKIHPEKNSLYSGNRNF